MNNRVEAALMITAGALLAAGATYAPQIGSTLTDRALGAFASVAPTRDAGESGHNLRFRLIPCQDSVVTNHSFGSANISSHDDRGGYTVSIENGELKKIDAEGEYTLEEDGDTVRILDPDGGVAFETSKSNPSIGGGDNLFIQSFGGGSWAAVAPQPSAPRAAMGIGSSSIDPAMAAQLGIDSGVVIEFIKPGSGAETAGLRQYDVITTIDGAAIDSVSLSRSIASHQPGDTVEVGVIRKGERRSIPVELGEEPGFAPAFDGFGFDELDALREMLQEQQRIMDSFRIAPGAPRPMLAPQPTPAPSPTWPLRPMPAPTEQPAPDANDAAEMAPKTRSNSTPA
ncbi:MAG: PDZ domain-containing protein [Phycisphaeraceae bacterium]|nr:PDZ domain-containing protein [Phycisphaeraceae bacterium]MCB9847757.1 PDZ domain-containing protein [Phycisphaeraceae bacterium]